MKRTIFFASLLALTSHVASCGAAAPAPREYPPRHGETTEGEGTVEHAATREPLREAPIVIEHRSETSATVTIRVAFDAGSADDPAGREGITALTARLMSEGGAGDLDYAALTARLFPTAGTIGARVGRDQTVFVARFPAGWLEEVWGIFRDVLTRPQMTAADFERVRAQATSDLVLGLRGQGDEALGKALLLDMLFEGHPYAHPELGTEEALAGISLDDLRAHRARILCPGRMTVGVSGRVPEGFAARVVRELAVLSTDACVGRASLPDAAGHAARVRIIDKPDASATAVSMGMPIDVTRGDDDYAALVLATSWLGQHRQFVGVLMQEIRELRGMNYGDYAYPEHFIQDGWTTFPAPNAAMRQQYFSIWLRPLRPEQAHFAMRLAIHHLRRFVSTGMTDEQVAQMRSYLDGYYALFLQTESRRLGFAIDDAFYGEDTAWLDALRARWATLTAAEVNAAIRRHIDPDRLEIAIVAPDATRLADAMASEAPSPMSYADGVTVPPEVLASDAEVQALRIGISRERIDVVPLADVFRR